MGNTKVLIVDDDTIICKLLSTFLQHHGYEPSSAYSGEEAIELLSTRHFDAVITDLKMGEADGFDVLRHARKAIPQSVLIMMTGCGKEENRRKAYECGADDFFYKPFSLNDLLRGLPPSEPAPQGSARESHLSL